MPHWDTNSTVNDPVFGPNPNNHFTFRAQLRVVPIGSGRRLETIRDGELMARQVYQDLQNAGWNVQGPVAYVPQFGNTSARLSFTGFVQRPAHRAPGDAWEDLCPTTDVTIIHPGTVPGEKTAPITGNKGGSLSWGQDTKMELDVLVAEMKNALEMDLDVIATGDASVDNIEVNGVKYGRRARSFLAL